jgi:hypothetical protein
VGHARPTGWATPWRMVHAEKRCLWLYRDACNKTPSHSNGFASAEALSTGHDMPTEPCTSFRMEPADLLSVRWRIAQTSAVCTATLS